MSLKMQSHSSIQPQSGAALVVALVFMTLLTTLSVTMVYNTALDSRMSTAYSDKGFALHRALGGLDEFINNANNGTFGVNPLASGLAVDAQQMPRTLTYIDAETTSSVTTSCMHQRIASDMKCRFYQMQSTAFYGRLRDQNDETSAVSQTEVVRVISTQMPGQ